MYNVQYVLCTKYNIQCVHCTICTMYNMYIVHGAYNRQKVSLSTVQDVLVCKFLEYILKLIKHCR